MSKNTDSRVIRADVTHIQACRNAWVAHKRVCQKCQDWHRYPPLDNNPQPCFDGLAMYDEYRLSIYHHAHCEHLEVEGEYPLKGHNKVLHETTQSIVEAWIKIKGV